jgi:hypothetical protein
MAFSVSGFWARGVRLQWRWKRALLGMVGTLLCSMHLAHADMWTYVDERGIKHFASSQLDKRYGLLFRGVPAPDAVGAAGAGGAPIESRVLASAASDKSIAALEVSPRFMAVKHHVRSAADANQLDFALLQAVIATESGFVANAVSPKGAVGLMQVMPATGQRYGLTSDRGGSVASKLTDPKINIQTGARYLRDLVNMFPGQLELAVAAYNAGEGAVQRAGNKIPNFRETQNYVRSVMQMYRRLSPQTQHVQTSTDAPRVRGEFHGAPASTAAQTANAEPVPSDVLN